MKKVYYLATCDTNKRILKELNIGNDFIKREIKSSPITPAELDEMKKFSGSYVALFSKRSRKYKELALKDKILSEQDTRELILKEYTFLKRPVFIIDQAIFIGNEKKTIEAIRDVLSE
ncbi:MAG: hypothetical protein OEX02_12455 [Cyclobacteriaceae bacterium]|nr:hypothetical protein [Cyclobacteriaceae bacterium]